MAITPSFVSYKKFLWYYEEDSISLAPHGKSNVVHVRSHGPGNLRGALLRCSTWARVLFQSKICIVHNWANMTRRKRRQETLNPSNFIGNQWIKTIYNNGTEKNKGVNSLTSELWIWSPKVYRYEPYPYPLDLDLFRKQLQVLSSSMSKPFLPENHWRT